VDVSVETEDCCVTTLASACCTRWRRATRERTVDIWCDQRRRASEDYGMASCIRQITIV